MASTSLLSAAGDRARNPALRIVKTHPKSVMRTGSAPPDQILWPTIIARPAARPTTSTNSRSGGSRSIAWIVATVLCLRIIIPSATTMQYSPRNFAKKIVSGDIKLLPGSCSGVSGGYQIGVPKPFGIVEYGNDLWHHSKDQNFFRFRHRKGCIFRVSGTQ